MKSDQVIEKIRARLAAVDVSQPRKVPGVFQLNIKATDGTHAIIVDLKNLLVSEGVADSPDVTLDVDDETLLAIGGKTLALSDAISQGKVTVAGDDNLVAALAAVL